MTEVTFLMNDFKMQLLTLNFQALHHCTPQLVYPADTMVFRSCLKRNITVQAMTVTRSDLATFARSFTTSGYSPQRWDGGHLSLLPLR